MRRLFRKPTFRKLRDEMSECEETGARMSDYIEGDLDDPGRERVEQHVKSCPRCRNVLTKFHLGPFSPWRG